MTHPKQVSKALSALALVATQAGLVQLAAAAEAAPCAGTRCAANGVAFFVPDPGLGAAPILIERGWRGDLYLATTLRAGSALAALPSVDESGDVVVAKLNPSGGIDYARSYAGEGAQDLTQLSLHEPLPGDTEIPRIEPSIEGCPADRAEDVLLVSFESAAPVPLQVRTCADHSSTGHIRLALGACNGSVVGDVNGPELGDGKRISVLQGYPASIGRVIVANVSSGTRFCDAKDWIEGRRVIANGGTDFAIGVFSPDVTCGVTYGPLNCLRAARSEGLGQQIALDNGNVPIAKVIDTRNGPRLELTVNYNQSFQLGRSTVNLNPDNASCDATLRFKLPNLESDGAPKLSHCVPQPRAAPAPRSSIGVLHSRGLTALLGSADSIAPEGMRVDAAADLDDLVDVAEASQPDGAADAAEPEQTPPPEHDPEDDFGPPSPQPVLPSLFEASPAPGEENIAWRAGAALPGSVTFGNEETAQVTLSWPLSDGIDAYLARTDDETGAALWARSFGGPGLQSIRALDANARGELWVLGEFENSIDLGAGPLLSQGGLDLFVARLSPAGGVLWQRAIGGPGDEHADALSAGADDGVVALSARTEGGLSQGGAELGAGAFVLLLEPEPEQIGFEDLPCLVGLCDGQRGCVLEQLPDSSACDIGAVSGTCRDGACESALACFDPDGLDLEGPRLECRAR